MKNRFVPPHFLLVLLFLAWAPAALASTTWYVDGVNGNDRNDCRSPQTACKTIGHAISLASSGDSIHVAPAIYHENLTINISLRILGASATNTILDGKGLHTNLIYIPSRDAHVVLSKVTIRNGGSFGVGGGGGIANGATLTVNDAIITNNRAEQGAGIENGGTITINRSTVSKNIAEDGYDTYGGGIYNGGQLTINNSTLSGNVARGYFVQGGAIYNAGGMLSINNSTLSGNQARDYGDGGAIENDYQGTVTISNSTISENGAFEDGSSAIAGFAMTLQNSIVANSHPGGNCSAPYKMISRGYNLSSDDTCHFNKIGDLNNTDAKLGTLGNHGGPTQTIPLLNGSPAIDAGNPSGCRDSKGHLLKTDQRGKPRPDHEDSSGCDMGAYERQKD